MNRLSLSPARPKASLKNANKEELFNEIIAQINTKKPTHPSCTLLATPITTPVGTMLALADTQHLYLLEFMDHPKLIQRLERLSKEYNALISKGSSPLFDSLEKELETYFATGLHSFKTPLKLTGTVFQTRVWLALLLIPYGTTISYKRLADSLSLPKAYRAVANANGANNLSLIIPCHRIIASNGSLGGYGSGVTRKKQLITHEQKNSL